MSNLALRAISGAVYVGVIVGAIVAGEEWFFLLTALLASLGIVELRSIVNTKRSGILGTCLGALDITAAIMLAWLPMSGVLVEAVLIAPVLMVYFLLRGVAALYDRREHPFRNAAWSVFSVLYLGLPMYALNTVYMEHPAVTKWVVLILFAMIWLNDTGAYCFGSLLGRHKMFPRLSPKKSWEGFGGGLLCCLLAGWGCFAWFNGVGMSLWQWLLFGLIACVFATWGDLFESLMKRNARVKDSGFIIPGHGGILDRIDSLLFVAPAIMLYLLALSLA